MVRCKATHKDGRVVTVDGRDPQACDKKAMKFFKTDSLDDITLELVGRTEEARRGSDKLKVFYTFEELDEMENKRVDEIRKRKQQGLI